MAALIRHGRIDWTVPANRANPLLSTKTLLAEAGGKMFGVLAGRDGRGRRVVLRAFSGQFNGIGQVEGWAPPLVDQGVLTALSAEPEQAIKRLGQKLAALPRDSEQRLLLGAERRLVSRQLMSRIHGLYLLRNFRGEECRLCEIFSGRGAPPSGTGECCAPKLLNAAVRRGIHPEGMAEFYWGRTNRAATREHGRLYPACSEKCRPILGFLLCGLR